MSKPNKYRALEDLALLKVKQALYAQIPVKALRPQSALSGSLGHMALMGVGAGLGSMLMRAASAPVGTVTNSAAKGLAFQQMMQQSDAVRTLASENPQKVKSTFDVLYQYFPAGAAEPYTASSLVQNLSQYDTVDHNTISDLIGMQKNYAETHEGRKQQSDPTTSGTLGRMLNILESAYK